MLCHMLVTSLLRRREFCIRLQISTSCALLLAQSAKDKNLLGLMGHMWYHITSACVTPMPVFSKNIVVLLHTCIGKIHLKPKPFPNGTGEKKKKNLASS